MLECKVHARMGADKQVTHVKLGMKAPSAEKLMKASRFALPRYTNASRLPAAPASTSYRTRVLDTRMLANDKYGCCTISARGHAQIQWAAVAQNPLNLTYEDVVNTYLRLTGGKDTGLVIIDELDDWRINLFAGNLLKAYIAVSPQDHAQVIEGIWLFGGLHTGVNLPLAWQNATVWTAPSTVHRMGAWAPGSWGGHCVTAIDYDAEYVYVKSWGETIPVTWAAFSMYFSEAYGLLNSLWFDSHSIAPSGFDLDLLTQDLSLLPNAF